MVYQWLSKQFISYNPSGLLIIFQANHQHLFKWIISHHQVDNRPLSTWFMNGFPNSLSATISIQVDYPCELLTTFQADHQYLFKLIISHHQVDNRPLSKWFMNGYPNSLSATIHVNY